MRSTYLGAAALAMMIGLSLFTLAAPLAAPLYADDWPQWRGPKRDGVWNETGIIDEFESDKIKLRWRTPVGSGYSGPTVAGDRVYLTDRLTDPKEVERVHCFDFKTGKIIWTHTYDCEYKNIGYKAGPRASVLIDEGRAYSLGAMGHLFCFDAAEGKILWKHDLNLEYKIRMPIWGIAASPIIEKNLLIVEIGGEGNACLVAFDKVTGRKKWTSLPDRANYAAPLIIDQAGKRVLICWTGDRIVGVDAATGKQQWEYPFKSRRMPLGVATPIYHQGLLFVTGFYDGSVMLRIDPKEMKATEVWRKRGASERNTAALHSIISTPYLAGDYIYGVDSYGELRCLELMTGKRIWQDDTAVPHNRWATIHTVVNGDKVWMFNEAGELIIAKLSPKGFEELSRAKLIEPTKGQLKRRGGGVCWSHPAYAQKHVLVRNDKELVSADLSAK